METKAQEGVIFDTSFVQRLTNLPISKREKEILVHLGTGKTNKQIADTLSLSTSTIRNHISNIFTKLKISNRAQATAIAIYSGLITPETFIEEGRFLKT
ncbi:MAG: hypothetical protein A3B68_02135 [Candidatus Melainabacteria bacterium RIFCSPHIGHO2_02_FULL_34_12]|nr:MAG: hypothetical protein A3B68_02135 [Candidatus Melainabacteria bacterium RIFCSPHIGHO2_02_FULL_34_12]